MTLSALQRVLDAQLCPRCRLLAQRRNLLRRGPVRAKAELIDDVTEIVVVCILEVGHLVGSDLSTRQRQSGTRKRSVIETAGRRAGTWTHQFLDLHHVVLEGLAGREVQVPNDLQTDQHGLQRRDMRPITLPFPLAHLVDLYATGDTASLGVLLLHLVHPPLVDTLRVLSGPSLQYVW
jgi:hypothetical protein